MRYGRSEETGELGVAAVQLLVAQRLRWVFRLFTGPDFGIDAVVEQTRAGSTSGRWLSLQIKSGPSYFKELTDRGVVFRDSLDHLEYYRSHQLPVIVVLYDPNSQEALWQNITPNAVECEKGYKVIVPFDQLIGDTTAADWATILTGRKRPVAMKSEVRIANGSLVTIHDLLAAAEEELLVVAPHLSVDFLALLSFLGSNLRVRVITSEGAIDDAIVQRNLSTKFDLRVEPRLHQRFIVADREVMCVTSANFTQRGVDSNREVLAIDTERGRVHGSIEAFEMLWQQARSPNYGAG